MRRRVLLLLALLPRLPPAAGLANACAPASEEPGAHFLTRQSTTWVPSSTTRFDGILKKAVALPALRNIATKIRLRQ